MLARLRKLWLNVHLWIGVGLFIPIVIIGVTGAILVFHDPLDRLVTPHRYAITGAQQVAASQYERAARAALGERFVVQALRFPLGPSDPVTIQARAAGRTQPGQRPETRTVWLDPPTARVLDSANTRTDVFGIMHQLHGNLMIPEIGRRIVGWIGWAMTISCLTGVWLWWPRNNNIAAGLRWRRGPHTTFNLHHLIGFWIMIPLAVLSLTGVYISFPQTARAFASNFVAMSPAQPRPPGGPGGPPPLARTQSNVDTIVAAARAASPNPQLVSVNWPSRGRGPDAPTWRAEFGEGQERISVRIEDGDGDTEVEPQRPQAAGDDLARVMRRVHDGNDLSPIWQWIIFIGGVAPAILGVTGIIMWLRRSSRRAALAAEPAPAQEEAAPV